MGWIGGENLGIDDRIILVGSGAPILGPSERPVGIHSTNSVMVRGNVYLTTQGAAAAMIQNIPGFSPAAELEGFVHVSRTQFDPSASSVVLWNGTWGDSNPNSGEQLTAVYLTVMPSGILTSQGLV